MANLRNALTAKTNPVAVKEDARGSAVKTYFYFERSNQAYDAWKAFEEINHVDGGSKKSSYIREAIHKGVTYHALVVESGYSLTEYVVADLDETEEVDNVFMEEQNEENDENLLEGFDELPEIKIEPVSQETLDNMVVQPTKVSYTLEVYATKDVVNGQNLDPNKWMPLAKWNKGLGESNFISLELARNEKQRLLDNVLFGVTAVRIFQTHSTHIE